MVYAEKMALLYVIVDFLSHLSFSTGSTQRHEGAKRNLFLRALLGLVVKLIRGNIKIRSLLFIFFQEV